MQTNSVRHRLKQLIQHSSTEMLNAIGRDKYKPGQYQLVDLPIKVPNLGTTFNNYTIIQLSDIHLGFWMTPKRLAGLIQEVNALKPDLVVMTGDYVSYIIDPYLPIITQEFTKLLPKDGVIAILGNHDHWLGSKKIIKALEKAHITVLQNQVTTIYKGKNQIHIAGLDDAIVDLHDLKIVMSRMPQGDSPAIMLAHEPDLADETSATGRFFLQLSGHSHAGQIGFPYLGHVLRGPWFQKYPAGKYQVGKMIQYTNRGVGTNTFRFRINCPPEITRIILISTQSNPKKLEFNKFSNARI